MVRKLLRYAGVSVISTATSLTVLATLVALHLITPGWANVVATAVGTVPSFELNRRWVWGKSGSRSLLAEVGPFCALSFGGLALSTVAVSAAARWAAHAGLNVTVAALAANVGTFGSLWLVQFVLLDRVLFKRRIIATT